MEYTKVNQSDNLESLLPSFLSWLSIERDVSKSTYTHHKYQLQIILNNLEKFNEDSCRNYLAKLKQTVSAGTLENYIYSIRIFCDYLVYKKIITENFGRNIPLPRRSKKIPCILSVQEVEAILNTNIPESYKHYPDPVIARQLFNTILGILARCGYRVSEVIDMKVQDINWIEGTHILNNTKTRQGRIVPLPKDILKSLNKLTEGKRPSEYVFINPFSGQKMTANNIGQNFRMRLRASGVRKHATVHTLRHSFIVEMFKLDVSVLKIANIVGHSDIQVTQDYARLLTDDLREALYRHPMTASERDPREIMEYVLNNFNKYRLEKDERFSVELTQDYSSFNIKVKVI